MEASEIPTLMTERLRLRGIRGSDFEDYAALYADPEVTRFIGTGETWDRGRSWRHMAFAIGHWQLQGAGVWVVEEQTSAAFVGVIGFWEPEDRDVSSTGPVIRLIESSYRRETAQSSHFKPGTRTNSFALEVTKVARCRRACPARRTS
jgi:RimJ/RimL family protein N-acetyltransferase